MDTQILIRRPDLPEAPNPSRLYDRVEVNEGFYPTANHLVNQVNKKFAAANFLGAEFRYNSTTRVITLDMPRDGRDVVLTGGMASIMGFGPAPLKLNEGVTQASGPVNMNRGVDALYVYADVLKARRVGDSVASLLATVPVKGEYMDMVHHEYTVPIYGPVSTGNIAAIEVNIRDSGGRAIYFASGVVTLVLHFRRRK